jgi:adenine deaminase
VPATWFETVGGALDAADVAPSDGLLQGNPEKDIFKIVVVNRYHPAPVAKSFIRGFGLKKGALTPSELILPLPIAGLMSMDVIPLSMPIPPSTLWPKAWGLPCRRPL